jgi:hypothetical protein
MKTNRLIFSTTAIIVALSLTFTGCRKKQEKDSDTSGAEDNSLADKSFEDMGQIANEAASGNVSSYKDGNYDGLLSLCATKTHDTVNHIIVVDFGTANCLCNDGRYRRGKIFISYSNSVHPVPYSYWDSLTVINISTTKAGDPSSDTYFVGNDQSSMNQIIGTKVLTNKGHNAAHHMNWDITANGQVIKSNGTIQWQSTRNREWLAGEGTPQWSDDEYGITGSANGNSANGTPFTMQITSQLIRKVACAKHFVSGTFDFTPGTKPVRHVDFSPPNNGACDNIATVTINGNTYTVYMH